MRQAVVFLEKMIVEKVSERAVTHIVEQGGGAGEAFHVTPAGDVALAGFAETLVEGSNGPARHVHRTNDVLEAGVLGGGVDPPGGLQLVDLPHPLDPGMIKQPPLGGFALRDDRNERNIAVNRVVTEAFALKILHGGHCDAGQHGGQRPVATGISGPVGEN